MYHIYVHIPFCTSRCPYCYFTAKYEKRQLVNTDRLPAYIESLCAEISATALPEIDVGSIVFGGGTPSLLSSSQAQRILQTIYDRIGDRLLSTADIGYEIMPDMTRAEKLDEFIDVGFTRVSVGAQSFLDEELRILGRRYGGQEARDFCLRAINTGYDTVNIDLLMAFPGQRSESLLYNLETAIDLTPEQISLNLFYATYPDADKFIMACRRIGREVLTFQDKLEQYRDACRLLAQAGYSRLDNTVFIRPNTGFSYEFDAISETVPIISFGPGSGAFWNGGVRYTPPDIEAYIASPTPCYEPLAATSHGFTVVWGQLNTRGVIQDQTIEKLFNMDLVSLTKVASEVQALLETLENYSLGQWTPSGFRINRDTFDDAIVFMHQVKDLAFGYRLDTAPEKEAEGDA